MADFDALPSRPKSPVIVQIYNCGYCEICQPDGEGAIWDGIRTRFHCWPEESFIQEEITRNRLAYHADQTIDIHSYQQRRRVAKAICLLLGSRETGRLEWEIAGEVIDHSENLKNWLVENIHEFEADEMAAEAGRFARTRDVRHNRATAESVILEVVNRWTPGEWRNRGEITHAMGSQEKRAFSAVGAKGADSIIAWLQANGGECDSEWNARGAKYRPGLR